MWTENNQPMQVQMLLTSVSQNGSDIRLGDMFSVIFVAPQQPVPTKCGLLTSNMHQANMLQANMLQALLTLVDLQEPSKAKGSIPNAHADS